MIEVRDLAVDYGDVRAVDGVSFEVPRGQVFGFIGPNGAGKTTTIRVLATLLEPAAGEARIAGLSVTESPEEVRRRIGWMPDAFGVWDGLRIWEYLDFFAAAHDILHRDRRRTVDDVMELTDLRALRDRDVGGLSKGMLQRLSLARTLVHDPEVLLLDEPAAGLDPRARIEMRALLRELAGMGKTVVISSHILSELADMCGSVGVIETGTMIAHGDLREIRERLVPDRIVRISVLGDVAAAAAALDGRPGLTDVQVRDDRLVVRLDGGRSEVAAVVRALVEAGHDVTAVAHDEDDLEGLFLRITRGELA